MTNLEIAQTYLALGWSVIPICPPDHANVPSTHTEICTKPGKVPVFKWAVFQQRRPKPFELEQQWKKCPSANIGIVMGNVSNLVGIDIDSIEGDVRLTELAAGDLPKTLMFNTGRDDSYRLLYQIPENHPCPIIPFRDGSGKEPLKILGNGSQTVAPPSIHPNGCSYAWIEGQSPNDLQAAAAPKWLLSLLSRDATPETKPQTNNKVSRSKERETYQDAQPIPDGGRDTMLTAIAGAVRRFGCTQDEIQTLLDEVNKRCEPQLDTKDIKRIARSISKYRPEVVPPERKLLTPPQKPSPLITLMDDVFETPLEWLWPGWIPLGHLVCIDGDGGVGKSTMLIDLAARITRNDRFPDGSRPTSLNAPQNVLMVACEDVVSSIIKPRLIAAKADQKKVLYLENVLDAHDSEARGLEFPRDLDVLNDVIKKNDIRFCFIDPILAFLSSETSYASDQDVRRTLGPLKRIADENSCTIVYVRHLNKGSIGNKATYRGGGSMAFINAARTGLFVGKHPDRKAVSVLCIQKTNFSIANNAWMFETVPVPNKMGICSIKWLGATDYTADQINAANSDNQYEDKNVLEEAKEIITDILKSGPTQATQIYKELKSIGIGEATVRRARKELGITPTRKGNIGTKPIYFWELPPNAPIQAKQQAKSKTKEEADSRADREEEKLPDLPQPTEEG